MASASPLKSLALKQNKKNKESKKSTAEHLKNYLKQGFEMAQKHDQDIMVVVKDKNTNKLSLFASDQQAFSSKQVLASFADILSKCEGLKQAS